MPITSTPSQSLIPSHEILLAFDNLALASVGATAAATSYATGSGLAVEEAINENLDTAWRSGELWKRPQKAGPNGEVYYTITLSEPAAVNWIGLHRHNIRVPFRVEFFQQNPDAGGTPVYASDWIEPIVRAALSDYEWLELDWNLAPRERQLEALAAEFRLDSFVHADATYYAVRYVRIYFDASDEENGAVDFLQVGLFYVTQAFRPEINMILGWALTPVDYSEITRTPAGSQRGRFRRPGLRLGFTLSYLLRRELYARILEDLVLAGGQLRRVFAWAEPHHRRYFYSTAILGTLSGLPEAVMAELETPSARGFAVQSTE